MRRIHGPLLIPALLVLAACGSPAPQPDMSMEMTEQPVAELVDPDAEFSPVRYLDTGLVTLNGRCPVRKVPLNVKMQAVYVNGSPIGFC